MSTAQDWKCSACGLEQTALYDYITALRLFMAIACHRCHRLHLVDETSEIVPLVAQNGEPLIVGPLLYAKMTQPARPPKPVEAPAPANPEGT